MKIPLPEQIALTYSPAHFGSRAVAYVCDFILRWTAITIAVLLVLYTLILTNSLQFTLSSVQELSANSSPLRNLLIAGAILFVFVVEWTYPICFEVFRNGVTPGKQFVGLRVVDESGLPITFSASFLRTALLIVDLLPATGLVGLVFMCSSKRRQRLGDTVARTVVIYDIETEPVSSMVDTPKQPLPVNLYTLLGEFLSRLSELLPETKETVAQRLTAICNRMSGLNIQPSQDRIAYLEAVYASSYPTRTWPAEFDTRSARIWKDDVEAINQSLAQLTKMNEPSVTSHQAIRTGVETYQEAAGVYAKWSTWFPDSALSSYAETVLQRGRRMLYGHTSRSSRRDSPGFIVRVRNSYNTVKHHCLTSFLISMVGALVSWLAVAVHPEFAWNFVDEETASQLQSGAIWTDSLRGLGSIASAGIMTNNISVTINAFALGITAGIGTIALLLFNGIHLGGVFAALVPYGMAPRLLEFILAHGVLELSIIFVAGGCGLYLADGIINPGTRTRREALQEHARMSADLLVYSALWLVLAGIIEGNISPSPTIHWGIKLLIGISAGGLYWSTLIAFGSLRIVEQFPSPARARARARATDN